LPYHRIPRARLHEDITTIEREGERIVAVELDGDDAHVFTGWIGDRLETRPATELHYCTVDGCGVCSEPTS
jgi:hypothetical protein